MQDATTGPDATLVAGLRAAQPQAFDAVFAAFHGRVVGYLARMLGRRDLADDLAQEVFLRLASAGTRLEPATRLAPWLFTVAHHVLVSHLRAHRVRQQPAAELAAQPIGATSHGPFEALAAGHTQLRVERALAALPAAQREVVVLVALEGLSTAEVARATASTEVAIRQRLSRARAAIAAALVEHSPKGGPHDR